MVRVAMMVRFAMYGALVGVLIAGILLVAGQFVVFGREVLFLWPTSFFLMIPHGHSSAWDQFLLMAFAIAGNVVLYSVGGLICFLLFGGRSR